MKIAILGAGISGLGAAWALHRSHEVHVFEQDTRIGGHTHSHTLADGRVVDTGFIVHNPVNYPRFVRLMEELGVPTCLSDMSFAFDGPDLPWCSRGLNGLFTRRRHLLSPRFWHFWKEVMRFNAWGNRLALDATAPEETVREALDREGFSRDLREAYLYPMAGAVWSTPPSAMDAFPVLALLRFFRNHGMLGVATQHPWRTIPGGTSRYLDPLTRPFRDRIRTGAQVTDIRRHGDHVSLHLEGEGRLTFDQVVLAIRGDLALKLLGDPTPQEREILGAFRGNTNPVWLHTDTRILPEERRGWASWNLRKTPEDRLLLTYHMNRLQPLPGPDLLVTLHPEGHVEEAQVLKKLHYEHPAYDLPALKAQSRWSEISGHHRTHFAGAAWGFGFHEDGLKSGYDVADTILQAQDPAPQSGLVRPQASREDGLKSGYDVADTILQAPGSTPQSGLVRPQASREDGLKSGYDVADSILQAHGSTPQSGLVRPQASREDGLKSGYDVADTIHGSAPDPGPKP